MKLQYVSAAVIFYLTLVPFLSLLGMPLPHFLKAPSQFVAPLRSFNSYGLFAVMTPHRFELTIEGSPDNQKWSAYSFRFKPGDLLKAPYQVAPHQPRLDWQMWFAALSPYQQNPWLLQMCSRLLKGSEPVAGLFEKNPFPYDPPRYLRIVVYEYTYSSPEERRSQKIWWKKEWKGYYCPIIALREP